jgi:hypothetical protein
VPGLADVPADSRPPMGVVIAAVVLLVALLALLVLS